MIKQILSVILCLALSLLSIGCVTTQNGDKQVDLTKVAGIVEVAAYSGVSYYLVENPQQTQKFSLASKELGILIEKGVSLEAFIKIVETLPIKELKSKEGKIIVNSAIIIFGTFKNDLIKLDELERTQDLKVIAKALKSGIDLAIEVAQEK